MITETWTIPNEPQAIEGTMKAINSRPETQDATITTQTVQGGKRFKIKLVWEERPDCLKP